MKISLKILTVLIIFLTVIVTYVTPTLATDTGESTLIEMKENQDETLEEYIETYGSDAYGVTAYILHLVQIYSIPFCFLAIVISIIYKVVLGTRNLENAEKGLGMIVAVVTLTIICQVLPLIFAIVVKFGKE